MKKLTAQVVVVVLAAAAAHVLLLTLPAAQCYWLNPEIYEAGGLSRRAFPEGFVFGTAASAYQVEGMAKQGGRGPSIWDAFIEVPGTIPNNATADVTVDEYHRYKEDVNIMKNMGFDAYRFSISWSRIFPNGTGKVNREGVDYYNTLIDYLIQQGITPYANLYHYDLPLALHEQYLGWLSPKIVYTKRGGLEFSWILCGTNLSATAVRIELQHSKPGTSTLADERNGVPIGTHANSYWLYIEPWGINKAVNYVKETYENPTMILAENGMDQPGNVSITQGVHDTIRIRYYRNYIKELKKAIDDGARVIGYFAWSLLDNFEWRLGYTSRFRLVYVDYKTLKRYPKDSAFWFKHMLSKKRS
ncbi:beta-glucosidase 26 [Panicum miliaceum]|uniref:Beta-glucosidase 26 n=1 Tax=Panicum miliaceum TaxID=4540 RepID=A0A3L6TDX9_PANMI|nr:beta-glucosidase 26 [Panicum miliaceum]